MENVPVQDRVVIAFEGRETEDGRTILPGALFWEDLPLPVFAFEGEGSSGAREVVGKIVKLERTEWGEVVATMSIEMPSDYVLSLDGGDTQLEVEGSKITFSKMRICGGTLIPRASWAWNA